MGTSNVEERRLVYHLDQLVPHYSSYFQAYRPLLHSFVLYKMTSVSYTTKR